MNRPHLYHGAHRTLAEIERRHEATFGWAILLTVLGASALALSAVAR